jgi:protein-disulfide isomerase
MIDQPIARPALGVLPRLIRAGAALLFTGLLAAAPLASATAAEFTDSQKTELGTIIRDYLMKNPEVLRDAISELESRQHADEANARSKAIADNQDLLQHSQHNAVVGNVDGKFTLVEFFDYNCGYCKTALPDLVRLMKDQPDLRVVLKDFPVLGPGSVEAAQVAIALRNQLKGAKYWDFHQKLLGLRGKPVGKAEALAAARDAGADMAKLTKDMDGPEIAASLQEVGKLADALSLSGTPTYIVGDEVIVGAVGYDQIKGRLDNMRKCGKAACT